MRMKLIKFSFLATATIAALALSGPETRAQGILNEEIAPPNSKLISKSKFFMSVVNKPGAPRNEITLRLFNPYPIQGCAAISPFYVDYEVLANMVRVNMDFPIVDVDRSVRYPHYECKYSGNDASADITLNLEELNEKMVTRMLFKSPDQSLPYAIYFDDNVFRLTPVANDALESLIYWRLPENTIVLSIPGENGDLTKKDPDLIAQLYSRAQARNLTPIQDVVSGFVPNSRRVNRFFFVDESGALADTLTEGEQAPFEVLQTTEPFYGPNGKYDKAVDINVTASLPASDD